MCGKMIRWLWNTCKLEYMASSNLKGWARLREPTGKTTTQLQRKLINNEHNHRFRTKQIHHKKIEKTYLPVVWKPAQPSSNKARKTSHKTANVEVNLDASTCFNNIRHDTHTFLDTNWGATTSRNPGPWNSRNQPENKHKWPYKPTIITWRT